MAKVAPLLIVAILFLCSHQGRVSGTPVEEEDIVYDDEKDMDEDPGPIPEFTVGPKTFHPHVGDTILLPCQVDHLGAYTILWKKSGEREELLALGSALMTSDARIRIVNESIEIRKVEVGDMGKYICQISSNPPRELVHVVDVQYAPSVRRLPASNRLEIHAGHPVTLQCQTTGNPPPTVTWTRHGKKKFASGKASEIGSSLTFSSADRHHSGVYECRADNGIGESASADVELVVTYEPILKLEKLVVKDDDETVTVELTCDVHGEPKPKVWWLKDGSPWKESEETHSGSRHVVTIKSLRSQDFGDYSCVAENKFGRAQNATEVTGLAGPVFLLRNKPLVRGVQLDWLTESIVPVHEYELRYGSNEADGVVVMIGTKARRGEERFGNVYNHVHQLHNMQPGTTYQISISSRNDYGWSKPTNFTATTLGTEEKAEKLNSGMSSREWSWWSLIASLVLVLQIKF